MLQCCILYNYSFYFRQRNIKNNIVRTDCFQIEYNCILLNLPITILNTKQRQQQILKRKTQKL